MRILKPSSLLSKIIAIAVAMVILAGYILLTNPNRVPLPLLLVPFGLIGFIIYQVTGLLFKFILPNHNTALKRIVPIGVSVIIVALLVLASLHQLTWKDTLLVILFVGLFWLYLWRANFFQKKS